LEVWRDGVPEDVGCRGEWGLHTMETFGVRGSLQLLKHNAPWRDSIWE